MFPLTFLFIFLEVLFFFCSNELDCEKLAGMSKLKAPEVSITSDPTRLLMEVTIRIGNEFFRASVGLHRVLGI